MESMRIYLRKFQDDDYKVLLNWSTNPIYHQTAGFEEMANIGDAKKVLQLYKQRRNSFMIILKKTNTAIGIVELYERGMDTEGGLLETKDLGFMLDQNYWHQGLMTESLNLLIEYAFNNLKQKELWAGTLEKNKRSQHLLKKLGFKYIYSTDYSKIINGLNYQEKYFLLTPKS